MIVLPAGGIFEKAFIQIGRRKVVCPAWFNLPPVAVTAVLKDLSYVKKAIVIDGKQYRPWVHPSCQDPRAEIMKHISDRPWFLAPDDLR